MNPENRLPRILAGPLRHRILDTVAWPDEATAEACERLGQGWRPGHSSPVHRPDGMLPV